MAQFRLASLINPHPCNQQQEDRNWQSLQNILQRLDEIIVIDIDENNQQVFNLQNINELTTNVANVTDLTTVDLSVTNELTANIADITDLTVVDVTATNIDITNNLTVVTAYITTAYITTNYVTYNYSYVTTYDYLVSTYGDDWVSVCCTPWVDPTAGCGEYPSGPPAGACTCLDDPDTATFTGTVSDQTGDATQIVGPLTAAHSGAPGGQLWRCEDFAGDWADCDDPFVRYVEISCSAGTPPSWSASIAATWGTTATVTSSTCDPITGKWTVVVDYTLAGAPCKSGTFTITWVQD